MAEKRDCKECVCQKALDDVLRRGVYLLEGEESCTHLNGTAEGDLAISLAEVHVSHTQVGSLNEHWEVYLFPTSNTGVNAEDADVTTIASGTNAAAIQCHHLPLVSEACIGRWL